MRDNRTSGEGGPATRSGRLRRLMTAGSHVLQIGVASAGLLTLFASSSWIADLMANLRLQLIIAGVAAALVALLSKRIMSLTVQLLVLCLHASWVLNPPVRANVTSGKPDITVTAVNAFIHNDQYETVAAGLKALSADVITVTELSPALYDRLTAEFADSHPHVAAEPHLGAFGVGIFSRYPLSDIELIGSATTGTSLLATIRIDDTNYRVAAVHPYSPMSHEHFKIRNLHLEALSEAVETMRQQQPAVLFIITGDFNLTPWSPHFRAFQQTSGLLHAAEGSGLQPTWYARGQTLFPFGLVLDHCMLSPELGCVSCRIGPSVASDHLPLTVRLSRKQ